jgi:hypothetical protein
MEYAFRNDFDGTITQVELNEFQLIIREGGLERNIPYATITSVRLEKKKSLFSLEVRSFQFGSISIRNQHSNTVDGKDQSRQYNTFVRILHYHLIKTQPSVEFKLDARPSNFLVKIFYVFCFSAVTYFFEDHFNLIPLDPLISSVLFMGLGLLAIFSPYIINPPKAYSPTDIPLTMLPPVT